MVKRLCFLGASPFFCLFARFGFVRFCVVFWVCVGAEGEAKEDATRCSA
jgi:hypothetical protein